MAEHEVHQLTDEARRREATAALLRDLSVLEELLDRGLIERGVRRIGAEQEMFIVDAAMRPSPIAMELLASLDDPRFTTELARFNLEANLPPLRFAPGALRATERTLRGLVHAADEAARRSGSRVLLTGILPTLAVSDLGLESMSPNPRYRALNDTLAGFRGGPFRVRIDGLDRFELQHDNVLFEACNTSFQLHLQVDPDEFAPMYNVAQAISGPLLAAATNSPMLMGHRLWRETRIALFEHATDARSDAQRARGQPPRVRFGDEWLERSILELYREDAARYPVVVEPVESEDSRAALRRGETPRLRALCAHTGTVWRWNRGCYGVTDGRPHLRIENRILPSGPTVLDEIANAALFYGLMFGVPRTYGRIEARLRFEEAKRNFFASARDGLHAQLHWVDGRSAPAHELLLDELLPIARAGLREGGLVDDEIERYLGIIEERVRLARTGADWTLAAFEALDSLGSCATRDARERAVVEGLLDRQHRGAPVHRWPLLSPDELRADPSAEPSLERIMTDDVLTVRPDDPIALPTSVMGWEGIHHVAVEDVGGRPVGLLSVRELDARLSPVTPVREVMDATPLMAEPEMSLGDAAALLDAHDKDAILVVRDGALVGLVTAVDLSRASPSARCGRSSRAA